ncbi:uncharacterized protein LOC132914964 [Bombus pascuorum]|uniref:uncharacterized protein LOC132914964 n=1 Tax=Bombus pascuorum TaxID=65598 RepID=UPI00212DADA3|nr:uncharacterized protein LOC132914964 [Bombus pascuorum]
MFERSFRRFVLLCLFVNAISGSPQLRRWDEEERTRNLRHASCPSCRRERPDTLVSWDTSRREYHGLEPESSPWQSSESFRRNPIFQQPYNSPFNDPYDRASYDRAIRSRGTPPVTKSTATCKRENPFTIGRDFDFDVASSQTTSIHSINNPASSYQSHLPVSRTPNRTPYRKPNFYDLIKDQSDLVPSSKLYADYGLTNSEFSMNNLRRQSGALANDEEDWRNHGAGKEFSVSTAPEKYFGDYGLSNSQSAFGNPRKSSDFGVRKDFDTSFNNEPSSTNFRRPSSLSISNEEYFRNFGTKKDFGMGKYLPGSNNEPSFNHFRRPSSLSSDNEDLGNSRSKKDFGLSCRSDRYFSDSFIHGNPMSQPSQHSKTQVNQYFKVQPSQYPKTEFNQYSKVQPSPYIKPEPIRYSKPEPIRYSKPEPVQYSRPEPVQYSRPEPVQYSKLEPVQYSKPEPVQYSKPEPVQYSKPEPVQYSKPEPPMQYLKPESNQYFKAQSNQYSKAEHTQYPKIQSKQQSAVGNPRIPYEREPKVARSQFVQSQRIQTSDDSRQMYAPEVKHSSYDIPGELNVFRTTQKVVGDGVEIVNSSRWEKQLEKQEDQESYEIDENGEQMGAEMVKQMDDSYQGNEQLESHEAMQQEEIKRKGDITSEDNNSRDKSGFSGNGSLGEDSPKTRLMQMETIGDDDMSEESTIETRSGV